MSEITDMTKERLTSSFNERANELKARYDELWGSYERLGGNYRRLKSRYNELKEKYEDLKQEESETQKAYDVGYEEGEQSMQEKAKKILEFCEQTKWKIVQDILGGKTELVDFVSNINEYYDKIIEYEKKKEQEGKEIHVGDEVVDRNGKKYVVRHLVGVFMYAMASSGASYTFSYSDVSKTGKHYPLDEMLKELDDETNK